VLFEYLFEAINIHKEFRGEKEGPKVSITSLNKTDTCDGYDFNFEIINDDEYNALQKESLMLFEAYCIFGFQEFFKNLFCIFMEVNKTMYGSNEDVPNFFLDNLYPESCICDVAFAVVWNVLAADENNRCCACQCGTKVTLIETLTGESQVMRPHKKHKQPCKHHHHADGAACPSSGVDSMNPCCLMGRWPYAYVF
jgi:hypothetical protein